MDQSMYVAMSGLQAQQSLLDATANNIANASTPGYKAQTVSFEDMMAGQSSTSGAGVGLSQIGSDMSSGSMSTTGSQFDLAIQGDGLFQVATNPGQTGSQTYYTRAGSFTRDANGDLVTPDGLFLVGQNGSGAAGKVNVPITATKFTVNAAGAISLTDATGAVTQDGSIQLANFPNVAGLTRDSGTRWAASSASGTATTGAPGTPGFGTIAQGELEGSNVDLTAELSEMIAAQRSFQANSRVISATDELNQNLIGLGKN